MNLEKKSIREIYRVYIKKLRKNGNIDLAVQNSLALYEFDKSDTRSLRIARSITRRYSKFEVLENIERQNEAFKHNFWSKIGLFDVLLKRYKKDGIGNLTEMNTILLNTVPLQITPYHSFEIKTRQVKLSFAKNNTTEAKNLLDSFADSLMGISSANFIDRYTILCVKYYKKINDDQKALIALNIALKQNDIPLTDPFLQKIEEINKDKDFKKSIHNERLNNFRIKLINNLEG